MKLKQLYCLAAGTLAACLVHTASAQNWTDTDNNHLFDDPNNWSTSLVPGPNDSCFIGTTIPNSSVCTILGTDVETVGTANGGNVFGPQWGATLNIYGSLSFGFILVPVQFDPNAQRSVINMYAGSSLTSVWAGNTLLLGDAWFTGQPYVTMNMYGNSYCNVAYLAPGGHLNIFDDATNIVNTFVLMGPAGGGFWGQAGPSDATRQINVAGGTFIIPTGNAGTLTNWMQRGIFVVYGKQNDTNDIMITDDGTYTYVKVPPLGGPLESIALNQPRSTMMVGTFQNPVAVGNFPNIQGAPLAALDAAQTGPGTVAYTSSDPTVASVDANGRVTAIKPGTTMVSATFGSFTSTNSVTITVTPFTNSLVHRYSFDETSGSTAGDSVGGSDWDGSLVGGATLGGGQVTLNGIDGYVQFPGGILSGLDAVTIEAWANLANPPAVSNAWLFAFGDQDMGVPPQGMNYIGFIPFTAAANASALFGAGDPGFNGEQDATSSLVSGGVTNYLGNVHVVCVYHPYAGNVSLYINGVLAAANTTVTHDLAATLGADPYNALGLSLYSVDPYLAGAISEFRIYNGPLTAAQVAADQALGPDQLIGTSMNVSLAAANAGGGNVTLSWPTNSALVDVVASPVVGAGATWTSVNLPMTVVGGNYQMTVPASGTVQFFRLQQY